ncbi:MAG: AraC family transcriptional regulator [Ruminiclostridium sp.]|nr:AraC family transcriptional regulator [Ruminiclostridium sp.]
MNSNYTFYEVPNNLKNDHMTDFINEMTFIPHAFGHQSRDPRAVCNERITGDFELICIVGGESVITIDNNIYTCTAGDVVLIPPFTMHKIQTPEFNPHENYWVHFDIYPFHLHKDFTAAMIDNTDYVIHPGMPWELVSLYQLLKNEIESEKPGRMLFVSTILVQIITAILRLRKGSTLQEKTTPSGNPAEAETVRKCLELIQNNVFTGIGIAALCKELHISESCLFKSFSLILNMSPNHFIQMVRIKKAEQLIKITNHTIKEISEMLGFSSPYYFSNVFKKFFKVSPREYMRSLNSSVHKY